MLKLVFLIMGSQLLSLTTTSASKMVWSDLNDNSFPHVRLFITNSSVEYGGIVLGKGVEEESHLTSILKPSGKNKGTDITEQFIGQGLSIENSRETSTQVALTDISRFWNSNSRGFACSDSACFNFIRRHNLVFIEKTSLINPTITATIKNIPQNAPKTISQNLEENISIPKYEYIFYKWGLFVLGCLIIIEGIIWLIDFVCQVYNSQCF